MNLENAILSHYEWKNKLKAAIAAKSQLDSATISRDDCCEFGKWLHGDGGKRFGHNADFTTLLQKHKTFHSEAGKVAKAINSGQYDAASKMMGAASPFADASLAVGVSINALKRVASTV